MYAATNHMYLCGLNPLNRTQSHYPQCTAAPATHLCSPLTLQKPMPGTDYSQTRSISKCLLLARLRSWARHPLELRQPECRGLHELCCREALQLLLTHRGLQRQPRQLWAALAGGPRAAWPAATCVQGCKCPPLSCRLASCLPPAPAGSGRPPEKVVDLPPFRHCAAPQTCAAIPDRPVLAYPLESLCQCPTQRLAAPQAQKCCKGDLRPQV